MLKVKSFKISDGEAISEHLTKFRLAEGANILISNGEIAVPFEDGEPMNAAQKIIHFKVLMNQEQEKADLVIHSQKVLEIQNAGIDREIAKEQEKVNNMPQGKADYDANKAAEAEIKRLQNVHNQTSNQMLMNQAELTRLMTNIAVFEESIEELSANQ